MNRLTCSRPRSILAVAALVACSMGVAAHPGGLAGDGCHKHKAAGERHWHVDGTSERGGECVKRDGQTVKVAPPEARIAELEALLAAGRNEMQAAEMRIAELQDLNRGARSQLAAVQARADQARAAADNARVEAAEARAVAQDAKARAAGHGPRVDQRCRNAVRSVVHGDTDWTGDVEVDAEGRAALTRACLES